MQALNAGVGNDLDVPIFPALSACHKTTSTELGGLCWRVIQDWASSRGSTSGQRYIEAQPVTGIQKELWVKTDAPCTDER